MNILGEEAIQGSDIILTIDANLQAVTEEALKNNVEKIKNGGFKDRSDATGRSNDSNGCKNWGNISNGKLSRL